MSDRDEIDALAAAFFGAFDNRSGAPPDMAALRLLFVPGAIVAKGEGGDAVTMDVETFIAPRAALLSGGRLTRFHEWE